MLLKFFEELCRAYVARGKIFDQSAQEIFSYASIYIVPAVHPDGIEVASHLRAIADAGILGVKFHPYYQDFSLSDPAVWPMFRAIADLGLVVECHAGEDVSWRDVRGKCGPEDIATLLKNVRGLRFIAAHLGGCGGYPSHATDALLEYGCYVDTSVLHHTWFRDEEMRVVAEFERKA